MGFEIGMTSFKTRFGFGNFEKDLFIYFYLSFFGIFELIISFRWQRLVVLT